MICLIQFPYCWSHERQLSLFTRQSPASRSVVSTETRFRCSLVSHLMLSNDMFENTYMMRNEIRNLTLIVSLSFARTPTSSSIVEQDPLAWTLFSFVIPPAYIIYFYCFRSSTNSKGESDDAIRYILWPWQSQPLRGFYPIFCSINYVILRQLCLVLGSVRLVLEKRWKLKIVYNLYCFALPLCRTIKGNSEGVFVHRNNQKHTWGFHGSMYTTTTLWNDNNQKKWRTSSKRHDFSRNNINLKKSGNHKRTTKQETTESPKVDDRRIGKAIGKRTTTTKTRKRRDKFIWERLLEIFLAPFVGVVVDPITVRVLKWLEIIFRQAIQMQKAFFIHPKNKKIKKLYQN